MRVVTALGVGLLVLLSFGCSKMGESSSRKAIREAIETHLKQRSDLMRANFNMELQTVHVTGNKAEADVKYVSKDSSNVYVRVRYQLHKTGDHWEVTSSKAVGGMSPGSAPHASPITDSSPQAVNPAPNH